MMHLHHFNKQMQIYNNWFKNASICMLNLVYAPDIVCEGKKIFKKRGWTLLFHPRLSLIKDVSFFSSFARMHVTDPSTAYIKIVNITNRLKMMIYPFYDL